VPPETVLTARGLVKRFAAPAGAPIEVLAGVDLVVRRGELVVIEGPSGSGKSTLLNVLGLLEDADAGEVCFADRPVSTLGRGAKSRERGRWLGFVFQSFLLLPALTALENVLLGARYTTGVDAERRRRAMALLERFGVGERRDHHPTSSRAASSSASRSAARCSTTRPSCSRTSQPAISTTPTAR